MKHSLNARRGSFAGTVGIAVIALFALPLVGCTSLTPHLFAEGVVASRGADGRWKIDAQTNRPNALRASLDETKLMRGRYLHAVAEQGNAIPQIAAGLLGLSALSLYKGVTGGLSTRDAAGAGVVGTTAWAWSSTLLPASRRDVYRAGAEALRCAMLTVEPFDRDDMPIGKPDDAPGNLTLHAALRATKDAERALTQQLARWGDREQDRPQALPSAPAPVPIARPAAPPACPAAPPGERASERLVREEACRKSIAAATRAAAKAQKTASDAAATAAAAAAQATPPMLPVPPFVKAAFAAAREELAQARLKRAAAYTTIGELQGAGVLLADKSLEIQLAVSREVEKTVPDLASVLSLGQNLRSTAAALVAGAGGAAVGVFTAQGSDDLAAAAAASRLSALDVRAVRALAQARDELVAARIELDRWLVPFSGLSTSAAQQALNKCSVLTTGVSLKVSPAGDAHEVPAGGSIVFFVSGGSGIPRATVGGSGALPATLEGGLVRFKFDVPASASAGTEFALQFTDGAGAASLIVKVRVAAAKAAAPDAPAPPSPADTRPVTPTTSAPGGPPSTPATPIAPATPATPATPALSAAELALLNSLTQENLAQLGLATGSHTPAQRLEAIRRCRRDNGLPDGGATIDAETEQLMRDGKCRAAG